ncbi:uncharacterized protein [Diadema setosum]|uniref:uncharacterized protein n=1 Tax=Diadema setosum TaxID=31175 RepID=UPI003B3B1738
METHHRFVLLKHLESISRHIDPAKVAASLADDHGVLPAILREDVARQPSPRQQAFRLVELVVSCGPQAFEALCSALTTQGQEKLVQTIRQAENDTRVADPAVLRQLRKATSNLPIPRSYADVCRNSAQAFTNDVWVEHVIPILRPPLDLTESTAQRVADEKTRQGRAEVFHDWLVRRISAHGHIAFFALLDALQITYPHVAEEYWETLTTIVITKPDPNMASRLTGSKGSRNVNGAKPRSNPKSDLSSNGKLPRDSESNDADYHSQLDRAVEVIGEANSTIRRMEDRVKTLETEKGDWESKMKVALRESYSLRTELDTLRKEKQAKHDMDLKAKRAQERQLKNLQEEIESKESLMADREIELRRRELEVDQSIMKVRKQQNDVEKQLIEVLEKEKAFEGQLHDQSRKDEELKRRDRALTVRESVIADKEDVLVKNIEDVKMKEVSQKKTQGDLQKKRDSLDDMKRKNEEVALKLADRKKALDSKEKELEITLIALKRDEADLLEKEERLDLLEEQLQLRQSDIREKEIELDRKVRDADAFAREKREFALEKQKWSAEAARIRNELDIERKTLRERELQLKTKEREFQIREKEWRSVKSALDKHLYDQEKLERSIKAIEMEQHRIEMEQNERQSAIEKEREEKDQHDKLMSSLNAKEQQMIKRINEIQSKERNIKSRERRLKDDETNIRKREQQLKMREEQRSKDGEQDMSLEDISETQTPSFRQPRKPFFHTPLDQRSTPESGFSDGHSGEYRILQRGITSAHHRNQAFTIKAGSVRTVSEMKSLLMQKEGIPVAWQQYCFNGKALSDTSAVPPPETLANGILDLKLAIPQGNLTLVVRMNSAISRKIEFDDAETIAAAKTRIYKSEGIPPHQQNLFYGEMELMDKFHLRDYNVQVGSELFLRLRYDVFVVISHDRLLEMTVEDLDTVGSLKAMIFEETHIPVDHQVVAYGATTMNNHRPLAHYRITEGSRIFVAYVIPIVMEPPMKETFTVTINLQTDGKTIKRMIGKFREFHPPQMNLVHHGRLLDDNVPIVEQVVHGGTIQLYRRNILVLDASGTLLLDDVQPWHYVAKIKEIISRKTGLQTRHLHLMHGDVELKTVNRAVKYFGVKRADVLVLRTEAKVL